MGLLSFLPGVAPIRLIADLVGAVAILYAGYDLIYKPIEKHGYEKGVAAQTKIMDEAVAGERKKTKEALDALEKLKADNALALQNVADAAASQVKVLQDAKLAAEKKASGAMVEYRKAREEALQSLLKSKGGPVPQEGQPYFAPIEIAGLSKPGVEAVNRLIETK